MVWRNFVSAFLGAVVALPWSSMPATGDTGEPVQNATEPGCDTIWPLVTVVAIPKVAMDFGDDFAPTKEEKVAIGNLVDDLRGISKPDVGLSLVSPWESVFIPVGQFSLHGERIRGEVDSFPSLRRLVAFGPKAMPRLLKSLGDTRRTELVIRAEPLHPAASGWSEMWFDESLPGNPANALEQKVLRLGRDVRSQSRPPRAEIEAYRVKVGDVCLAVIGQITGRDYSVVSVDHPVGGGTIICAPACSRQVRSQLREIWTDGNPKQRLLNSLLLDYSTRGVFRGGSLDDWSVGSEFQIAAAMRLLYYFPKETAGIITGRLDELDVSAAKDFTEQCVKNGVRADLFIDAIGWCDNHQVREALHRLSKRAADSGVLRALDRAGIPRSSASKKRVQ